MPSAAIVSGALRVIYLGQCIFERESLGDYFISLTYKKRQGNKTGKAEQNRQGKQIF